MISRLWRRAARHASQQRPVFGWRGAWLVGSCVAWVPISPRYYYARPPMTDPRWCMVHYTATAPGSGFNMARRRLLPGAPKTSWHLTVEGDGTVIQMVPVDRAAWHAGTPDRDPYIGLDINRSSVGVEFVGHGEIISDEQLDAGRGLLEAIARRWPGIELIGHSDTRRHKPDPGPIWRESLGV